MSLATVAACAASFLVSGCAVAGYGVKYKDGTEYHAYVAGVFKEPKIAKGTVTVGTNAVFSVEGYESKQDAARDILKDLIKNAANEM